MLNMRELRKQRGLTMKELGKAVGVAESTISLYETGKHEPDILTMQRIAAVLGVSVDALLGADPHDSPPPPSIDRDLIEMLMSLKPAQLQRVMDFVSGLKAATK